MKKFLFLLVIVTIGALSLRAVPFDQQIKFIQPDGTPIILHGWGDEFQAVFETADGYTVVFDPAQRAYCYAQTDAGGDLVSTGVQVHRQNAATLGLGQHVRMSDAVLRPKVEQRRQEWERVTQTTQRWNARKAAMRQVLGQPAAGEGAMSPAELQAVSHTTLGNKMGLIVLIDFDDEPATIPQAEVMNYANGDNYTGFGNNGSIKQYFLDNSSGALTYSNVATVYIRIPNSLHPKSYYNDPTKSAGSIEAELLRDAINILTNLPNYTSDILPTFASLTHESDGRIVATSVYFAGANSGVWTKGLWPMSGMYGGQELGNGMHIGTFCVIDIGASLTIGTFCHENSHMLLGYPDEYAYVGNSSGAGSWDLMGSGNYNGGSKNPSPISVYLKRASGWGTTIDLTTNSSLLASSIWRGADYDKCYRFQKPGVSTEYYLIENRQKTGRGADGPGAGLLLWHVDELGYHDYANTNYNTTHTNYENGLVQADNLFQLENGSNGGDAQDPFYRGNPALAYTNNAFTDSTGPSARFWDGSASGIVFADFNSNNATMTFRVGNARLPLSVASTILVDGNGNGNVDPNETNRLYVVLRNEDTRTATNISATISSTTAGVNVGTATASYPNAAPGALVTNTTPFIFSTTPGFVCGTTPQFTNVASCTGLSTTNSFALASTAPCVDGSFLPPVVTFTSPTNNQIFQNGTAITLTATATDADDAVARVEFYDGTNLLATATSSPYTYVWSGASGGMHTLKARAVDQSGLFAVTNITVGVSAGGALTWVGAGASDNWSDAYNWNLFRAPTNGEPVTFTGALRLTPANDALASLGAVTLSSGNFVVSGNWLTLSNGISSSGDNTWAAISRLGAAQSFVSSSSTLNVSGNVTNAGFGLTLDGAGSVSVSAPIYGSGNLTKAGAGTATLGALTDTNATGTTTVNAGRLIIAAGASGSVRAIGSGLLTVNSGATVQFTKSYGYGGTVSKPVTINGGTLQFDAFQYLGALNMTGGSVIGSGSVSSLASHTFNAATTTATISVPFKLYWTGDTTFTVADGAADPDLNITTSITEQTSPANLVKAGAGRMAIGGGTYTGTTVVKAGTLDLWGSLSGGGGVTVSNSAALTVKILASGTSVSASALSLGSGSGSTTLNLLNFAGSPNAPINVITLTANGTATINVSGGFTVGQYPLIKYSALAGTGFPALHLGTLPMGISASLVNNSANLSVDLRITGVTPMVWSGTTNGNWDINTTTNWTSGGTPTTYQDFNSAQMDDTAGGTTAINLSATVLPSSVLVSNTAKSYSLSGSGALAGGMGLTKQGSGTLTVGTTNSYSGATTIGGGTVQIGNTSALGTSTLVVSAGTLDLNGNSMTVGTLSGIGGTITDNSPGAGTTTLAINQSANGTFSGAIADGSSKQLAVTKKGSGTLTLSGNNTFSGVLNADEGLSAANDGAVKITASAAVQNVSQITLYNPAGGASTLQLDGSGGPIVVNALIALSCRDATNSVPHLQNLAGNISTSSGDPNNLIQCDSGTLNLGGILTCRNGSATYTILGSGDVVVSGTFQGLSANPVTVLKTNSSGALTLSGPQTHKGGTVVWGGQLNLNSATALGHSSSAFTNAGVSTIDNTSGGSITLVNNNTNYWNADFTFVGSNPLNLGNGPVNLGASVRTTVSASTLTVGGALSGSGFGFTKAGNGTLSLGGTNTYTGPTTVTAGALNVTGKLAGGGAVTINDGASLLVNANAGLTAAGLNLGSSGATTLSLTNFTASASAPINATNLTANGTVTVNISGISAGAGQYPLIKYTSLGGAGFPAFALGTLPPTWRAANLINNTANHSVDLNLTGIAPAILAVTPASATVYAGSNATFTVSASGSSLAYQWQYGENNVPGANGTSLTLAGAQFTNAGLYRVIVTNSYGSVTSAMSALTVIPSQPYRAQLLADAPVAWWRLNETSGTTAYDSAASYNGANSGSLVLGVSGPNAPMFPGIESGNTAYQFSGSGTSISLPALNLTSNITLTAWVKPNAAQGYYPGVIAWSSGGNTISLGFGNATNQLTYVRNGSVYSSTSQQVPTNQWTFIALALSPTNAVLYMATNSNLVTYKPSTTSPALTSFTNTAYIGKSPYGSYNGSIDEVAVFNQLLTPAQITNLVSAALLSLPGVTLTAPADGSSFPVSSNIVLTASVTTNGHAISKVQFFSGASLLGESAAAPYQYTWSGATAGAYTLLAQVVYDGGNVLGSSPAYITVTNALVSVSTNPTNILATISGTNLILSWPGSHTGWRLLMQTNNLASGVSRNTNDWGPVSGSTATNQMFIPMDPSKLVEFYRLAYP
ncbi:MAG: M6 family metalloprotease domain-containing protein [Verrucomicrobiota bacterium]